MRWSQTFIPTLKEDPADAQIPSHKLMLRAGLIRQLVAGAYSYLPLGLRSLHKAIQIVREEMNDAGAIELLLPVTHPVELWQESGRYDDYGDNLMKLKDRKGTTLVLGPTHEEVITDLVRNHISSYRQLPITLYQVQTKFRDEPRPRFGVLRTREFLMKDAYSFDTDLDGLNKSYDKMYQAYCRIFERCGLDYVVVEAESGPIGGDASHEFMVPSENGEDQIVECPSCRYAANLEKAEVGEPRGVGAQRRGGAAIEKVATPGQSTIEQVSKFLKCKPEQMIKTLIYLADGKSMAALVRGDHEVNENKLRRATNAETLELADEKTIQEVTGAPVGFAGPVGLGCPIVADPSMMSIENGVTGANEQDMHFTGVSPGKDFNPVTIADIRQAVDGDPCPRCEDTLKLRKGIEIGHVFKLGTKYSDALKAVYKAENGEERSVIMGCYGIGVNRLLAALIESNHDDNGIIWSKELAPFQILITPLNINNQELMQEARKLYDDLMSRRFDVLMDDRDARPGVKFKDADLIGIPLRIVIGEKGLAKGEIELKWRHESEATSIPLESAPSKIAALWE